MQSPVPYTVSSQRLLVPDKNRDRGLRFGCAVPGCASLLLCAAVFGCDPVAAGAVGADTGGGCCGCAPGTLAGATGGALKGAGALAGLEI